MAREDLVFGAKQVVEDLEEVACTQARQLVTRENAILVDAAMREAWELVCSRMEKRPRRHPELRRALRLVLADLALGMQDYVEEAISAFTQRVVLTQTRLLSKTVTRNIEACGPLSVPRFVQVVVSLA